MDEEEEEYEGLTAADRIRYVVTAPKRAFQGLNESRVGGVIGVSLLVGALLFVVSIVLLFSSGDMIRQAKAEQITRMEEMLDRPGMTEGQRESIEKQIQDIEDSPAWAFMVFGAAIPVFFIMAIQLLIALVVFVIAKIYESGHETRVKYSRALAVTTLAWIVSAIGGLVLAVAALLTGNLELSRGFGTLAGSDSAVVTALVGALGPNSIWWYIVVGIGIATIARTSAAKATVTFASVVILVSVLIGMLVEAVGGVFG